MLVWTRKCAARTMWSPCQLVSLIQQLDRRTFVPMHVNASNVILCLLTGGAWWLRLALFRFGATGMLSCGPSKARQGSGSAEVCRCLSSEIACCVGNGTRHVGWMGISRCREEPRPFTCGWWANSSRVAMRAPGTALICCESSSACAPGWVWRLDSTVRS